GRGDGGLVAAFAGGAFARSLDVDRRHAVAGAQGRGDRFGGGTGVHVGVAGGQQRGEFVPLQPGAAGVGEHADDVVEQVRAVGLVQAGAHDAAAQPAGAGGHRGQVVGVGEVAAHRPGGGDAGHDAPAGVTGIVLANLGPVHSGGQAPLV